MRISCKVSRVSLISCNQEYSLFQCHLRVNWFDDSKFYSKVLFYNDSNKRFLWKCKRGCLLGYFIMLISNKAVYVAD